MTPFGIVAIVALLAVIGPTHADVRDDPVGGGGGGAFAARCPFPQVLTGLELRVADDVDAVRPICVLAYGPSSTSTAWVSSPASAQHDWALGIYAISVDSGVPNPGLVVVGDRLWYGGGGGHPKSLLCPTYRPALLKMSIEAEGESTVIVHKLAIYCGTASAGPVDASWLWTYIQQFTGRPPPRAHSNWSSGPNHVDRYSLCPAGTIGVGIHGRSGVWLDALGIICDTPHYVPAPPPPPKTTAEKIRELPTQETHDGGTRHAGEILAATKGKGVQAVSAFANHPPDKATMTTPGPPRPRSDVVTANSNSPQLAAITGARTPANTSSAWSQATQASSPPITLASTLHLSLTPTAPAANAVARLKAEGISYRCQGITLRFGDGTPEEIVRLTPSNNAAGRPQQFERAHSFVKPGTYTIEGRGLPSVDKCPNTQATLKVVVR